MKKKVIARLVKSGMSETIAEATVCEFWEKAESYGCETVGAFFKVISKLALGRQG